MTDRWEIRFDRRCADGEVAKLMFDSSHFRKSFEKVRANWPHDLSISNFEMIPEVGGCLMPELNELHSEHDELEGMNIIDQVTESALFQFLHIQARTRLLMEPAPVRLNYPTAEEIEQRFVEMFKNSLNGNLEEL